MNLLILTIAFACGMFTHIEATYGNYNTSVNIDPQLMSSAKNSNMTLIDIATNNPNFSTLIQALQAADLISTLQGPGPFTIFAPNNDAFAKLPPETLQELLKPENKDKLRAVLLYHVIPGKILAADVKTMKAKTVNGKELNITANSNGIQVNNANVTKKDIQGNNGVIQVIDAVLLP